MFQNFLHTDYGSGAVYWAVRAGEWKWEGVEVGGSADGREWREGVRGVGGVRGGVGGVRGGVGGVRGEWEESVGGRSVCDSLYLLPRLAEAWFMQAI